MGITGPRPAYLLRPFHVLAERWLPGAPENVSDEETYNECYNHL